VWTGEGERSSTPRPPNREPIAMNQLRPFVAVAAILLAGKTGGQQVPVPSAPVMAGIVVDPDGKPAPGAEVLLVDGYIPLDAEGRPAWPPGKVRTHSQWPLTRGRGTADAQGRFRMEVRGKPLDERDRLVLWTYKPGALATSMAVERASLPDGTPARIRLEPASETVFRVFGPDGDPVVGARVVPTILSRESLALPEELRDRLCPATNAEGEAVTTALRPDEVQCVRVFAPGLGMQQWSARSFGTRDGAKVLNLLPVGPLKGRVVDGGKAVDGVRLLVATIPETVPGPYVGVAEVTSDARGRFELPELPEGKLIVRIKTTDRPEDDVRVELEGLQIRGGQETELEVEWDRGRAAGKPR
jgi:hypothetical protein